MTSHLIDISAMYYDCTACIFESIYVTTTNNIVEAKSITLGNNIVFNKLDMVDLFELFSSLIE